MHNYYEETCVFTSKNEPVFLYKRNYWDGYHSVLRSDIPGLEDYPEVFLKGEEGSGEDKVKGDEAIVFSDVNDSNEDVVPYDDGCWRGFTKSFDRFVKIQSLRPDVQNILEMYSGDQINMKCSYDHLEILGDACGAL
jgi:hypothetical protein